MRGFIVADGQVGIGVNQHGQVVHCVERREDSLLFVRMEDAERFALVAAAQIRVYSERGLRADPIVFKGEG